MAKASSLGQLPLWVPKSDWRAPQLSELPSWEGARRISIDTEFRDPELNDLGIGVRRPGTYLAGISFAIEDGPEFYVPLRHQGGGNVEDPEKALQYFRDQAKLWVRQGDVVGMNLSCDLDWLLEAGINLQPRFFRDVAVADPLINELHYQYNLDVMCKRWGLPGKDRNLLRDAAKAYGLNPKSDIALLPAKFVGPYAATDARRPLQLLRKQERELENQKLWPIYDLESQLLPVLVRMRRRGVRVSEERLAGVESWAQEQEAEALAVVYDVTGIRIAVGDVWKPEPLARALEATGVQVPQNVDEKSGKTSPSVTKELLSAVEKGSPKDSSPQRVAKALSRARKTNKLRTTFAKSVRDHMVRGRIHCTFNQLRNSGEGDDEGGGDEKGAAFGRLSCEAPNMQQQPARDEFAKRWRSIYLPEEGAEWVSADFSQQEPRMMVHYAEVCELAGAKGITGAIAAAQRYRDDPKTDNHTMMTKLIYGDDVEARPDFKQRRDECKQILLGKMYGMGGAKLCDKIGLPTRFAVFYNRKDGEYRQPTYYESWDDARRDAQRNDGKAYRVAGEAGQKIISLFDERLPFVKGLAKKCESKAKREGLIRTILGRACHFPTKDDGTFDWTHKALNRLIQGSSADQTKKALIEADAAGLFIQLQVHDEINESAWERAQAKLLGEIMTNTVRLNVPFAIDLEVGPSWGEAEKLKEAA